MAKRRQLEAPSPEKLKELEEGFARETRSDPLGISVPIARVAGEAAAQSEPGAPEERAARARDERDASAYRHARDTGLLVEEIPLSEINADELMRDRMAMDAEELAELKGSIAAHGLRLPIEVFELAAPKGDQRFGLLSGYRRLAAIKALLGDTGKAEYTKIRAIVRAPEGASEAFVAMVEENEIRSGLSQYERGRVAVIATENGAFESVDAAIAALYQMASKAKRSKLRSFALVHEELGDLLSFPQALTERQGLRLAGTLRNGLTEDLRRALASGQGVDAELEWSLLEPVIRNSEEAPRDQSRGGRPRNTVKGKPSKRGEIKLANGSSIKHEIDRQGHVIRFHGSNIDTELVETVMLEIERLLEPI